MLNPAVPVVSPLNWPGGSTRRNATPFTERWQRYLKGTSRGHNLMSCASLAPVLELVGRAGLHDLVAEQVRIDKPGG